MNNPGRILWPVLQGCQYQDDQQVDLELLIPQDLAFFEGHFEQMAIVPGVIQIHWAVYYARQYLMQNHHTDPRHGSSDVSDTHTSLGGFYQMQAIKFKSLLLPNAAIHLELRLTDDNNKLYFRYYSSDQEFSSGRLYFKTT